MIISKDLIKFLSELNDNNNREWFDTQKLRYLKLKDEFEVFVEALIQEFGKIDKETKGLQAKKCIFRIYRDVRFSGDKSPYKINFGAELSKGGRRSQYASYYIHIEPGECFIGGGLYMPEPPVLKAVRNEIYQNIDEFKEIINAPNFLKYFEELADYGKLQNIPKGFPKDFPEADLLKHKHFTAGHHVKDNFVSSPDYFKRIIECFTALNPMNRFLNAAICNTD
jgi:uncharacterized protein (TIGR02453 family)